MRRHMGERKVRVYGDEVLRVKSKPVKEVEQSIEELVREMYAVLEKEGGIGLAATPVGLSLRVIMVSIPDDRGRTQLDLGNGVMSSA